MKSPKVDRVRRSASVRVVIAPDAELASLEAGELAELFAPADLVFDVNACGRGVSAFAQRLGIPSAVVSDWAGVEHRVEEQAIENALLLSAELARALSDLAVNGVPVGTALAFAVGEEVRREWVLYALFSRVVDKNSGRTIACRASCFDAALQACLTRLSAMGLAEVLDLTELRGGIALPGLPCRGDAALSSTHVAPLRSEIAVPEPVAEVQRKSQPQAGRGGDSGEPDGRAVNFFLTAGLRCRTPQTVRLMRELRKVGCTVRLVRLEPETEVPADLLEEASEVVSFVGGELELLDRAVELCLGHLQAAIGRVQPPMETAAASDMDVPLSPYFFSMSRHAVERVRALVVAAASAAACFKQGPRSSWLPETFSPIAQVVIAAAGRSPLFTTPPNIISTAIRDLQFIDPNVCMLAYGSQVLDVYRDLGLDPEGRVFLTGGTQYDEILDLDNESESKLVRGRLGINPDGRVIAVMISERSAQSNPLWLRALIQWAHIAGERVVIRINAADLEVAEAVRLKLGRVGASVLFATSLSERETLCAADAVVTDGADVAVLAAIMKRPLVQMDAEALPLGGDDLASCGVALKARNAFEAIRHLRGIEGLFPADPSAYASFAESYNSGNDGCAVQRCAALLAAPPAPRISMRPRVNLMLEWLRREAGPNRGASACANVGVSDVGPQIAQAGYDPSSEERTPL